MNAANQKSVEWTSLSLAQNAWHSVWEDRKTVFYISFFGLFLPQIVIHLVGAEGGLRILSQAANITGILSGDRTQVLPLLAASLESLFSQSLGVGLLLWPIFVFSCLSLVHLALKKSASWKERLRILPSAMIFSALFATALFLTQSLFLIQFAIKVLASVAPVLMVSEALGAFSAFGKSLITKYLKDATQTGVGLFFNLATPHALISIFYDLMSTTSNYWAENTVHLGGVWSSPGFIAMLIRVAFFSFYLPYSLYLAATVYQKARKRLSIIT
ncbi:MAG: hypothetical protein WCI18_00450 [Pseudomonadota bacterium]